ncbi:MAG: SRPBCC domain-containing protein [Myxococcota bacterium]
MSAAICTTTVVAVEPALAFELFTAEVDAWWRAGPRFRWHPERGSILRFEPGVGGRFLEEHADGSEPFEVGRIRVWDPPSRLVFGFRARSFAPEESTEVEVRFEVHPEGCRVSVEHRGFETLAPDHPARHGADAVAFRAVMGVWWADLLDAARRRAREHEEKGRTP